MSDKDFESSMKYIAEVEGGANFKVINGKPVMKEQSKRDIGGPTKYGITWGALNKAFSQGIVSHADITQITKDEAKAIYKANYWLASKADLMKWGLCLVHFDAAVNHGVAGAGRLLQKTLNSFGEKLSVDGIVGTKTLAALDRHDLREIILSYLETREAYYRAIVKKNPAQGVFLKGWLNRLERIRKGAL